MHEYDFDVFLSDALSGDLIDDWGDRLFELFMGDVTPGYWCGQPYVSCTIESAMLEKAISRVVLMLRLEGLSVSHIKIHSDSLAFADTVHPQEGEAEVISEGAALALLESFSNRLDETSVVARRGLVSA